MLDTLLNIPFIKRTRRNHGLEHATIHMMSTQIGNLRVVGRSDDRGFWLWGDIDTDLVEATANEALKRMRRGEHHLAIHPNCGTNLVTTAMLGGGTTMVALIGSEQEEESKLERFPLIVMGLLAAIIIGRPLGMQLQRHVTTLGDPGDLEITDIRQVDYGMITAHRVETWSH